MTSPIEFFFDFGSGYSYFAATEIDALAARHGRETRWRAFSLGTAFRVTQAQPLTRVPLKSDYTTIDWGRIAATKGIAAFGIPEGHPHAGLPALRGFHLIDEADRDAAKGFALEIFRLYFRGDFAIDDAAAVGKVARAFGAPADFEARIAEPRMKAKPREVGEEAVARGVFGAPWFFVDGEPFWGWDRLPMIERKLAGG